MTMIWFWERYCNVICSIFVLKLVGWITLSTKLHFCCYHFMGIPVYLVPFSDTPMPKNQSAKVDTWFLGPSSCHDLAASESQSYICSILHKLLGLRVVPHMVSLSDGLDLVNWPQYREICGSPCPNCSAQQLPCAKVLQDICPSKVWMAGLSTTKEKDSGLWLGKPISDLIFSSTSFSRIELTDEQDIQHIDGYNYSLTTQRPFGQKIELPVRQII